MVTASCAQVQKALSRNLDARCADVVGTIPTAIGTPKCRMVNRLGPLVRSTLPNRDPQLGECMSTGEVANTTAAPGTVHRRADFGDQPRPPAPRAASGWNLRSHRGLAAEQDSERHRHPHPPVAAFATLEIRSPSGGALAEFRIEGVHAPRASGQLSADVIKELVGCRQYWVREGSATQSANGRGSITFDLLDVSAPAPLPHVHRHRFLNLATS